MHIWEGPIQEMQEDCDEEVEAIIEMSEDERGLRALVCHHLNPATHVHHATCDRSLRFFTEAP